MKERREPLLDAIRRQTAAADASERRLQVAGMFAGIGGIELGLHMAGHETAMVCEIDEPAVAVLKDKFRDVKLAPDITKLKSLPSGTDLVAGGFPCQDLSQAGKTVGITGERSGLVGYVFDLVRARKRRPSWILLENVSFMLQLQKGRALDLIVTELEHLGYAWAYRVVNSQAFGLPQRRERVYLLASLHEDPRTVLFADDAGQAVNGVERKTRRGVAYGFYWTEGVRGLGWAEDGVPTLKGGSGLGIPSPPAILMPNGRVVKPDIRDAERMQGFPADWTRAAEGIGKRGRNLRWKLVGNAVTVDVAAWIGERLIKPGEYDGAGDEPLARGGRWPRAAYGWSDGGRFVADVSAWPKRENRVPLKDFLDYEGIPLSARATRGFIRRTESPKTTITLPPGFLPRLEKHLERMERLEARAG